MKVLILEDAPHRIEKFKEKLNKEGVALFFASHVEDAKKLVEEHGNFDSYFLDHDLEGQSFVDSEYENTGYQFAKYLEEKFPGQCYVIVHSMNPQGAKNIASVFSDQESVIVDPFWSMIENVTVGG